MEIKREITSQMQEEIARVKASLAVRIAEYDDFEPSTIATQPAPPRTLFPGVVCKPAFDIDEDKQYGSHEQAGQDDADGVENIIPN